MKEIMSMKANKNHYIIIKVVPENRIKIKIWSSTYLDLMTRISLSEGKLITSGASSSTINEATSAMALETLP